jgi:hypothetical protein
MSDSWRTDGRSYRRDALVGLRSPRPLGRPAGTHDASRWPGAWSHTPPLWSSRSWISGLRLTANRAFARGRLLARVGRGDQARYEAQGEVVVEDGPRVEAIGEVAADAKRGPPALNMQAPSMVFGVGCPLLDIQPAPIGAARVPPCCTTWYNMDVTPCNMTRESKCGRNKNLRP